MTLRAKINIVAVAAALAVSAPADLIKYTPEQIVETSEAFFACWQALRQWLLSHMRAGVHYGVPPGCEIKVAPDGIHYMSGRQQFAGEQWEPRAMLYKAGGQFIAALLGYRAEFHADNESWEQAGRPSNCLFRKCLLFRGDKLIGEGNGAGIIGAKQRDANGAIKIGNKCALSDAILNVTGLSDLFVQDQAAVPQASKAAATGPQGKRPPKTQTDPVRAGLKQLLAGYRDAYTDDDPIASDEQIKAAFAAWCKSITGKASSRDYTAEDVVGCKTWLKQHGIAPKGDAHE